MITNVFRLTAKNQQSAMIADETVYISSKRYSEFDKFYASVQAAKGLLSFESITSFPVNDVSKVALPMGSSDVTIHYYSSKKNKNTSIYLPFDRKEDAEIFARSIADAKGFSENITSMKAWDAIQNPLVGIFVTALFGWLLYTDAATLEAGETIEITGRRKGFQQIIAYISEILGTTGTLIVAGLLTAYFVYLIIKKLQIPPKEYIFE
jgi:hypothetical protein